MVDRLATLFLEAVVAYPAMSAAKERERLLAAMVGVYTDAEAGIGEPAPGDNGSTIFAAGFGAALQPDEEELVGAVRAALEAIAGAVSGEATGNATVAALGGAELSTRTLISTGEIDLLPRLLPGFAYLVSLPGLGEPEAARRAERVRAVVEDAGGKE